MIYCLFPSVYDLRVYDDTTFIQQLSGASVRCGYGLAQAATGYHFL